MKLTLKIKLLPDATQKEFLMETIKECNSACNVISKTAFTKRLYNQFKLHKECYYDIKDTFSISAQLIVRCISKVADSYKIERKTQHIFKPMGGISYDSRILTYKTDMVSIWCIGGRQIMSYICHNKKYIPYIKGEACLVFNKGKCPCTLR